MPISDKSAWRYPGDSLMLETLLHEDVVRRGMESGEFLRDRDMARARLLASGVMVEPRVLPHLAAAVDRLTAMCEDVGDLECFVYSSPEVNAFITRGRRRTLVALSSAAVNHFDTKELEFVLGHELGHALFGHVDMGAAHLIENGRIMPDLAMRLRAWQRAAEISADRAGLVMCESPAAAASALFKSASGIVAPGMVTSPEHFAAQWERLLNEVVEAGHRDFWQVSHPFPPLRMQAMLLFWNDLQHAGPDAVSSSNDAIARMLAMMDPTAGAQTLHDPVLAGFFFWGGLYIALSDRQLHAEEMARLEDVVPPGVDLRAAVSQACDDQSLCLTMFRRSIETRRQKLSSLELHRVIYGLIDVASADGRVSPDERERLHQLAAELKVPVSACELIVSQYEREVGHAG